MKRRCIVIGVVIVLAVVGAAFGVLHVTATAKTATTIPVGSSFAVVKQHSQGTKPACLAASTAASNAVRKDDFLIDGKYSAFDLATTMGIIDVPAGTNLDTAIHSYDSKTVTGSIAYPPKYGSYNVVIVPSSKSAPYHQWTMTSIVACQKR